jgi:phosphate starvation-inducible PhoH-like protein
MLLLKDVDGVGITHFESADVVRHPLVKKIVDVYEKDDPS